FLSNAPSSSYIYPPSLHDALPILLTFLAIACKQKFVLDDYSDEAVGHMEKNAEGRLAITRVELHPKITWSGEKKPTAEELDKMHHGAHDQCFIANSVKTEVTVVQ